MVSYEPHCRPKTCDLGAPQGVTIGLILFAIQQFAGINALVYYSTSVFRQASSRTQRSFSTGQELLAI